MTIGTPMRNATLGDLPLRVVLEAVAEHRPSRGRRRRPAPPRAGSPRSARAPRRGRRARARGTAGPSSSPTQLPGQRREADARSASAGCPPARGTRRRRRGPRRARRSPPTPAGSSALHVGLVERAVLDQPQRAPCPRRRSCARRRRRAGRRRARACAARARAPSPSHSSRVNSRGTASTTNSPGPVEP